MHNNTYNFRPKDSVLDRCHCVTLTNSKASMREMKTWCWDSGSGLVWAEIMEPRMFVENNYDRVAVFYFESDTDATMLTMFRLRWL